MPKATPAYAYGRGESLEETLLVVRLERGL